MEAQGKRKLEDGREYDHLITKAGNWEKTVKKDADLDDTIDLIKKVVKKYHYQVRDLAKKLKGASLEETCENIWNFLYKHVQYRLDDKGKEQIHTPSRIWAERKRGIDCDDYTVMISSILTNLRIKHTCRIAKYRDEFGFPKPNFQHIYVIVPIPNKKDYKFVIDPVKDCFDCEQKFFDKKDIPMDLDLLGAINDTMDEKEGGFDDLELSDEAQVAVSTDYNATLAKTQKPEDKPKPKTFLQKWGLPIAIGTGTLALIGLVAWGMSGSDEPPKSPKKEAEESKETAGIGGFGKKKGKKAKKSSQSKKTSKPKKAKKSPNKKFRRRLF